MDIATLAGFISGLVFIIISMFIGAGFDIRLVLRSFIDYPSVMITIGGTIASTLIASPLPKVIKAMKVSGQVFTPKKVDPAESIEQIISLAKLARKESLLSLEEASAEIEDPFLKKGIMLIVDGTDADVVRNILETEMSYIENRHNSVRGIWEFVATISPSWGMIGTLIGLALMLQDMANPGGLGPKMAVALITTFYGSVISNFVAAPIANKLKIYSGEELLMKEVLLEGILSIQAGENPRLIEEKLKAFIAPEIRRQETVTRVQVGDESWL